MWNIIVNENMFDARAYVEEDDGLDYPRISGWERIYSTHATREEAEAALPEAREYAAGRRLP